MVRILVAKCHIFKVVIGQRLVVCDIDGTGVFDKEAYDHFRSVGSFQLTVLFVVLPHEHSYSSKPYRVRTKMFFFLFFPSSYTPIMSIAVNGR